jgi:hypothetical protein
MGDERASLAVDVDQKADEEEADDQIGAAVADEWQRHALVGKK